MTAVEDFGRSKQISLTTYRKDGTAVATPVWYAVDGGQLFVVSNADAWKVKRIRRNASVVVTACDIRGRVEPGAASAEGTARVLDDAGTQHARELVQRRYVTSRLGNLLARALRLRRPPVVGIAVSLSA